MPSLFPTDPPDDELRDVHDRLFLGTAGWSYDDWDGPFYPPGTSSLDRLRHYARHFRTVEIDSTFYGTPTLSTVQGWYERTPDDFVFAAKFPREITHGARLVDAAASAQYFVETMSELGDKLGPLLIQLPPSFTIGSFRHLAAFLEGLPDGFTYAVEVRHPSWLEDRFADLLRRWNVALCLTCSGHLANFWRVTSRVAYIRWLGRQNQFSTFDRVQADRTEELDWWVPRIRHFLDHDGVVFGYANNNYAGFAPETADDVARRLAT